MNGNADSFLRETLGVHTSRRRFHGGLNVQGGGTKLIGEDEEAKEAGGTTWIGMCEECICQHSASIRVSPAGLSVRA